MKQPILVLLALAFLSGCLPQGGNGEAYEIVEGPQPDGVTRPNNEGGIPEPPPPPPEGLPYVNLPAGEYRWERPNWNCTVDGVERPSPVGVVEKLPNGKWIEKGDACKPISVPIQHSRTPVETQSVLHPVVGFGRGSFVFRGPGAADVTMRLWCRDLHGDWEWMFYWDGIPANRIMKLYGRNMEPQVVEASLIPAVATETHYQYESSDGAYVVRMEKALSALSPLKRPAILTGPGMEPVSLLCRSP